MTYGKQSPLETEQSQPDEVLTNIYYRAAFCSLKRHTDLNDLKPSLQCKILDSMISPILTYNSDVWGAFVKSDFKSWDSSARKPIYDSVNTLIYKYTLARLPRLHVQLNSVNFPRSLI